MKKIRYTLVLVLSLGLFFSYNLTYVNNASSANNISIVNYDNDKKIEKEATKQLYVGESADYDVKFNDKYYDGKKGSISQIKTSNTKILNYKPNTTGEFNALSVGIAVLSATMSNVKTSLTVTVRQPVTSLMPKYLDITLTKGQSTQLYTEILPANATYKSQGLSYTSQNTNIVSVNQNGQVVANNQGHTKIDISFENKNRYGSKTPKFVNTEVTISVVEQPSSNQNPDSDSTNSLQNDVFVNIIFKDSTFYSIIVGDTRKINYSVIPSNTDSTSLIFRSENSKIATVTNNGTIKGQKKGETRIFVSSGKTTKTLNIKVYELIRGGTPNSMVSRTIDKYQFSFLNRSQDFVKSIKEGYVLSKKYQKLFIKKAKAKKLGESWAKKVLKDERRETWKGACYGMALLYTMNKSKLINVRNTIKQKANNKKYSWFLNGLEKPKNNIELKSLIHYYFVSQFRPGQSFPLVIKNYWMNTLKFIEFNAAHNIDSLLVLSNHIISLTNKVNCPFSSVVRNPICINVADPNKQIDYVYISGDYKNVELIFTNGSRQSLPFFRYTTIPNYYVGWLRSGT